MKPEIQERTGVLVLLITFCTIFALTTTARAGFNAGDFHPLITAGDIPGNSSNTDVDIRELRLGLGHYFREHLGFYTELSIYRPAGVRENRSVNTTGVGLEFAVRWHFLNTGRFSMYSDWGIGVMRGFDPFPPGGTRVNATPHFGLGMSTEVSSGIHILAGLRQLHMSNGKGKVPQNPSFDGLGAYLGLVIRPGYKEPFPKYSESVGFDGKGMLVRTDLTFTRDDNEDYFGTTIALDLTLLQRANIRGQIAYSFARPAGHTMWTAAVHLYRESERNRVALGYARQEFAVYTSDYLRLQLEHVFNDVSTITYTACWEHRNLVNDRIFGGLFVTIFPINSLALMSGIAFERQEYEYTNFPDNFNDAGFDFGIEWSPGFMSTFGLSVFARSGIGYDSQVAGLRFRPGLKQSLQAHYHGGRFTPID